MNLCARLLVGVVFLTQSAVAQTNHDDLRTAVDQLGDFDHTVRMEASRTLRRAGADAVLPVLLDAWKHHEDSYVQFRSIVLIYGLEEPRGHAAFEEALDSQNDRVRAAAYELMAKAHCKDLNLPGAKGALSRLGRRGKKQVRKYCREVGLDL